MHKIALYGFGSFPVVGRHLIDLARAEGSPIQWCAILVSPHYRKIMREVLPADDVLDVFATLPRQPVGGDLSDLAGYRGSLVEDLAALKLSYRARTPTWACHRAIDTYRLTKAFLAERRVTHLLMSGIETPEAKIAVAVAQELGLGVIAPSDLRNLGGTCFATDSYETPPTYAKAGGDTRAKAAEFVQSFRQQPLAARRMPVQQERADDQDILDTYLPPLAARIREFVKFSLERPDIFDPELIRVSVMRTFGFVREPVRRIRRWRNAGQYDVDRLDAVPGRFVFYPLQYTPESSINVPAPYFVDQRRAIDALRFAMPSDCLLVVKEHPACIEMRAVNFMKHVRSLPGVVVARSTMPSIELVKRALLTVSVTGTAVLEAFLLGRPALALGQALPTWVIGQRTGLDTLRAEMATAIANPPSDAFVIERIAALLSARYPFYFATAHTRGEPMLRRGNMGRFLAALIDHLDRERRPEVAA